MTRSRLSTCNLCRAPSQSSGFYWDKFNNPYAFKVESDNTTHLIVTLFNKTCIRALAAWA